ncbi:LysR family transcriptional regulator [Amycolatopsis sp. cmx-11-51]|uniref:LysR family transcriptional regulator n=1 Tax=Amycolatopsis sp. cmx-11-51 TaxID=2785797 RepID=UPI0039E2418F
MNHWNAPTVHQLRTFFVLAEELHFGRAAARLFMSQPALSRQFTVLEQRLGIQLLDRNQRSVKLTAAGKVALPKVAAVLAATEELHRVAIEYSQTATMNLVVGTIGAEAAMEHTRVVLAEVVRQHPDMRIEVRLLSATEHFQSLYTGDVDVVFCRPPAPEQIQTHHLATEPRVVCVPAEDPLASKKKVSLAELRGRVMIDYPPECPQVWRKFWAVDPRPDGTPVQYGPVVRDVESLLATVAQGRAIAFQPAAARDFFPRPGIAFLDVTGIDPCTSALAWHAEGGQRPAVKAIRLAAEKLFPSRT